MTSATLLAFHFNSSSGDGCGGRIGGLSSSGYRFDGSDGTSLSLLVEFDLEVEEEDGGDGREGTGMLSLPRRMEPTRVCWNHEGCLPGSSVALG